MPEALGALAVFYGPLPAPPRDLFSFFVWDVISARTVASRRDRVWQQLRLLPALTPDAMFRAPKDELKTVLDGLGGNVEERLDHLREGSGHFRRHRELAGRVTRSLPSAARVLRGIPHLSPAAKVTGLVIAGRHAAPAIDAGIVRVLARVHGLGRPGPPAVRRAARQRLREACGPDLERLTRALVILGHHAGHACAEQAPHCTVCPLRGSCAHAARAAAASSGGPGAAQGGDRVS